MHIDSINSVEDTKGNNGERGYQYIMLYVYVIHVIYCILFCLGSLIMTNLRLLWISHSNSKINLSVGLNTIVSANIKQAKLKLEVGLYIFMYLFIPVYHSIICIYTTATRLPS